MDEKENEKIEGVGNCENQGNVGVLGEQDDEV